MDIKAQIYSDMSALNSGFAAILTSLKALQEKGVISADYLQQQRELAEELRAGINTAVMNKRQESEAEDWHDFGKMRETTEKRLRGEQTIEGLPPSDTIGKEPQP